MGHEAEKTWKYVLPPKHKPSYALDFMFGIFLVNSILFYNVNPYVAVSGVGLYTFILAPRQYGRLKDYVARKESEKNANDDNASSYEPSK